MDDQRDKLHILMLALERRPGFAMTTDGVFTYWGVPLDEIPVDPREVWYMKPDAPLYTYALTEAMARQVAHAVDDWIIRRHMNAREGA